MSKKRVGVVVAGGSCLVSFNFVRTILTGPSRVAAVIFLSVVLLLALGCVGSEKEQIVFVSDRNGNPEIYMMDVDGTNQTRLTENSADDVQPLLSPDGKWVVFISQESGDRELNRIEVGKDEPKTERLTRSPGDDHMHLWSPDGNRVAFVSNRDGQPEIYLRDAEEPQFTRVTFDDSQPVLSAWSPDGQWLAFILEGTDQEPGIITRNPDGVNVRRLTEEKDYDITWSPNGERMAFISERDGNQEIYIMNSDGTSQDRLTHNTSSESEPVWSPDGKQLAFVSERDGNAEIYVMKADGASQIRLTFNDSKDESPVWSPDGKKILFTSFMYGTGEIIVMGADGDNQIRLTNNNANDSQPDW